MKLSSLFVSMLMGVSLFIPSVSFAQTQTTAELIQSLRVQIATLTAQIAQLQASGGNGGGGSQDGSSNPTQWCYAFNSNLGIGSRGKNVSALQHALNLELGTQIEETGYFGMNTASAVANFQDKYSDEILTSNNLSRGTGFVGVSTRRKLNQLYGCGNVVPVNTQAPVISGVQGPTALKVGETGTWSVSAYDPQNGVLSYSVIWGDEMAQPMPAPSPAPLSLAPVQQTATFTHSYANARIYTPVFYVTDNQGLSAKTSISVNVGETTPQSLGRLFIEVDTGSGFMQTSDAIKVDVGQSRRVRAMYQPPMPPCLGGPAGGVCLEIMPVPQEVSAQWTSSNPNIAGIITVETDCINTSPNPSALCGSALTMIRGISAGTAEIKALYAPYPNAYTATAKVSVVTPSTQPSITVTSPNGGEQWPVGSTQVIKWSPAPVLSCTSNTPCVADQADVDIYLVPERPTCLDAIPACKIMERAPILIARVSDTGLYNWNINASEGKYKIQVNRGTTLDQSDALFSIVSIVSPATKFQIGDRIKTTAKINVRRIPSLSNFISPILGTQAIGALGTVLTSSLSTLVTTYPAYVNDYWWWNVNFDSGVDGWVTENYLEIVATLGLVPNSSQTASIFEAMKAALLEMSKTLNSLR